MLALAMVGAFTVAGAPTAGAAAGSTAASAQSPGYPTTPPAPICGDTALLAGPATQPVGSVRIDPGQDPYLVTQANPPGTTFWLAPGVHTLGDTEWGQIVPKQGNTYIGGPGAVLDGSGLQHYGFTGMATGVTIRYLTVRNFEGRLDQPVVNLSGATGWTVEYNTITENSSGTALGIGTDNVVRYNCFTNNGQYGVSAYTELGARNILFDHNELSYNNADDVETARPGCGCSGGSKFWEVTGAVITNNWVHHNNGSGIWADTNATGFRIEGNYFNDNAHEAVFYETSYNAYIHNNTFIRNAIGKGWTFSNRGDSFPITAIYISESGGDARAFPRYDTLEVSGNYLEDNWGGITLWENANRFCNTSGSTAPGQCPKAGGLRSADCVAGIRDLPPNRDDCRWKTQNVLVTDNDFKIDKVALDCVGARCGEQGLFSNGGTVPPYLGSTVQDGITFTQNNVFRDNRYTGEWRFDLHSQGTIVDWDTWRAAPYNQDQGSTLTGGGPPPAPPVVNALDSATSGLEGSIGRWAAWFSATVSRSTDEAHKGSASLKVDITAADSWAVTQTNWPGFEAAPGDKTVSFWAKKGSPGPIGASLYVNWRDDSGNNLQTDIVRMADVGPDWQQAIANLTAPMGTTRVSVDLRDNSGVAGDVLYVDDVVVTEGHSAPGPGGPPGPPPPSNALDANTAGLEGGLGRWAAWFSAAVSRSDEQAHAGTHSLKVDVASADSWAVTQTNWPGFAATPGDKTVSFWAKKGSSGPIGASLYVNWRDDSGNALGTDVVRMADVGVDWQQATANLTAPAGTTRVSIDLRDASGAAGDVLYVDDVVVTDGHSAPGPGGPPGPPPPSNALDVNTSGLEASVGRWVAWFSAAVARSDEQAHGGTHSLKVDVTSANSWGVTLANWPGFAATPGDKTVSFWAMSPSTGLGATLYVTWRDASGADLRTDVVALPNLTADWQQATADVVAPPETARVSVDLRDASGGPGDALYVDDVVVVDR